MADRVHPPCLGYDGRMRWYLPLAVVSFLGSACGGASEQDVLSASSSGTTSATSSSGGSSTSSGGSSTSSSGGTTSSSGGSSSGPGPKDPGGTCVQETEPNDEPKNANELVTSLCGVLSPGSESEYLTFELPSGTKTMAITFDGDIEMRVLVEGHDPVVISPKQNPQIPFEIGKRYFIEVTAASSTTASVKWRVNLNRT